MTAAALRRPAHLAIPWRALLVGIGLGAAGAAVIASLPLDAAERAASGLMLAVLAGIAAWDAATHRAPNVAVYPAAVLVPVLWLASGPEAMALSLAAGAIALAVGVVLVVAGRGSMGYGDAKYAFVAGAAANLAGLVLMFLGAFAAGALYAAAALLSRRRGRKDSVAFTPFLAGGVVVAWLLTR